MNFGAADIPNPDRWPRTGACLRLAGEIATSPHGLVFINLPLSGNLEAVRAGRRTRCRRCQTRDRRVRPVCISHDRNAPAGRAGAWLSGDPVDGRVDS